MKSKKMNLHGPTPVVSSFARFTDSPGGEAPTSPSSHTGYYATKIKVLAVLPFYYPHRGGSQKYAEEIFEPTLKNHNDIEVDILCYNTDKTAKYEEYRGTRIFRIPCWNVIPTRFALPNPFQLIKVLAKLSKNKYDFVLTHIRFFDPTWWLWVYAKIIGAKSIFTGHVAVHPVHQNKIVTCVAKFADLIPAKLSLKFYDHMIFTNKTAQKFFAERLGVKKKTHVIYGGVDTKFFSPQEKRTQRTIPKINKKVAPSDVLVTYVGRMIWTKGVTFLYESIKEVLKTHSNGVTFVLAGPGEMENTLRKRVVDDNLADKIFMTGNLNYEQVRDLLGISDIFVNPSHHNEGFPNTILEAGSSGCCVIATDNAGTWEVIEDRKTGILVPQKDTNAITKALLWAIDNPKEREKLAENLRNRIIDKHDWRKLSEEFYHFLKKQIS